MRHTKVKRRSAVERMEQVIANQKKSLKEETKTILDAGNDVRQLKSENAELRKKIKHLKNVVWINSENIRLRKCLVSHTELMKEIAELKAWWKELGDFVEWHRKLQWVNGYRDWKMVKDKMHDLSSGGSILDDKKAEAVNTSPSSSSSMRQSGDRKPKPERTLPAMGEFPSVRKSAFCVDKRRIEWLWPEQIIDELSKKYDKPSKEFLVRADGRIEWLCEHGVGHTVWYPELSESVHGCDGCCAELVMPKTENAKEGLK